MKNIVTASIHFSFKGKRHEPSITLALDQHLEVTGRLPDLYPLIAEKNNFDLYSYEYEMMQAEEIMFSQAEGLVSDYINDGQLDVDGFIIAWKQNSTLKKLENIARNHMNISDLQQHHDLKQALLEAFTLGTRTIK